MLYDLCLVISASTHPQGVTADRQNGCLSIPRLSPPQKTSEPSWPVVASNTFHHTMRCKNNHDLSIHRIVKWKLLGNLQEVLWGTKDSWKMTLKAQLWKKQPTFSKTLVPLNFSNMNKIWTKRSEKWVTTLAFFKTKSWNKIWTKSCFSIPSDLFNGIKNGCEGFLWKLRQKCLWS